MVFVEQTPGGELAARLRELFIRLEPTLGFYVKVVERTGRKLQDMFPLNNLWGGNSCGREGDCITCYQGAEVMPDCTQQSILYENVCSTCLPGATKKEQITMEDVKNKGAALYVGETSRSIAERSREHWASYRGAKEDSHIWKHQQLEHGGEQAKFVMRVIGSHKTALARQVSEAVRIRRRGGETMILNSKGEYNRSHIPRLQVEEEEVTNKREQELKKDEEQLDITLTREQRYWEQEKTKDRDEERRKVVGATKNRRRNGGGKREIEPGSYERKNKRRRKYTLLGIDWGAERTKDEEQRRKEEGELIASQGAAVGGSKESNAAPDNREHFTPTTMEGGGRTGDPTSPIAPQVEPGGGGGGVMTPRLCQETIPRRVLTQKKITCFLAPTLEEGVVTIEETRRDGGGGYQRDNNELEEDGEQRDVGINDGDGQQSMNSDDLTRQATPSVVGNNVLQVEKAEAGHREYSSENTIMLIDDEHGGDGGAVGHDDDEQGHGNEVDECMTMNEAKQCEFKRGMCIEHKIKGDKMVNTTKKWQKKKAGYGWVTIRRVAYSCSFGRNQPLRADNLTESQVDGRQQVQVMTGGGLIAHSERKGKSQSVSEMYPERAANT